MEQSGMGLKPDSIRAILFDYGSTLIVFSEPEIQYCDDKLAAVLTRHFGPVDRARLKVIRDADRLAPYADGYHENNLPLITGKMVRTLYGVEPASEVVEELLETRHEAFVAAIRPPAGVAEFLARLKPRYRLGLVSNYPDPRALRASVERTGLAPYFDAVVVSGDVGRVKPHPLPFQTALDRLGVNADEALYVGDNWLGDVQGAKGVGMQVVWTRQHDTPEHFEPRPGDHQPDLTINHLRELEAVL
jgi:HAD superfamily hydrolase (TIGR01549 family)